MTPCIESDRTPSQRYPQISVGGSVVGEHRYVWTQANGPIPPGLFVCHRCDNKRCVRLGHLFLGTNSDNQIDAVGKGRNPQVAKTHCPKGHEYTGANVYRRPSRPTERQCVACLKGPR